MVDLEQLPLKDLISRMTCTIEKEDCPEETIIGSVDSLLTTIEDSWPKFLLHIYCNRQQRDYIKELRIQSTDKIFIVAQIDFSMNYALIRQREVQQGFFSQHQVTLFTIQLTIGQAHRNLAIISDHMEHTTAFLYCAQKIVVQFIKTNFSYVKKINYIRDVLSISHGNLSKCLHIC